MRPLDALEGEGEAVRRLLRQGRPDEVEAELVRLRGLSLHGAAAAARRYADGASALRRGALAEAQACLEGAAVDFGAAGEEEAGALARAEAWIATIRQGPRSVYAEAAEALGEMAAATDSRLVRVVATHYRATALRFGGQAEATLQDLVAAFRESDGFLVERAHVLNSLGTLYVVLGAFGAAETVLAHAVELNQQIGDRVSQAISHGQLGSAALGQGELERARRHLQQQEWWASQVGDAFGRARALTLLADVAIDLGRPDDGLELAEQARGAAASVDPPLTMWLAYAARTIGRAHLELGQHHEARGALAEAKERFDALGNRLGDALVRWELARLRGAKGDATDFHAPAWSFASLGLSARVAQVLADARPLVDGDAARRRLEIDLAAASQSYPHLATRQQVELVLSDPDTVASVATRRIGGQRNLGRMAALTLAAPGLFVAVVAADAIGTGIRPLPGRRSAATLVGQIPGVAVYVWPLAAGPKLVARDLSSLRVRIGDDARAVVGAFREAHLQALPFAGEMGSEVVGVELSPLVARALRADEGAFVLQANTPWNRDAEALTRLSGFAASVPG